MKRRQIKENPVNLADKFALTYIISKRRERFMNDGEARIIDGLGFGNSLWIAIDRQQTSLFAKPGEDQT